MNQIKAIGYVRVSTQEQAETGYSIDNQKFDIKKYCDFKGFELIDIFEDDGISGATIEERPSILAALRYIKENKVDYLIVWKLSRLSRKISDVAQISEFLKTNDTKFISIQDGIDTGTPMGEYFLILAGIFAQMERENLIVQVKGGMAEKARSGEFTGGAPNLGYDVIDKKLIINEEEAQIVRIIYNEYIKGNGFGAIVDILKGKDYKTKKGKDFSTNSVKDILKNPVYKGFIRWGYRVDWGKKDIDGHRHRKYNDDPVYVRGKHLAIIDENTFDTVQEMIKTNPRHHVKRFNGYHLLSGLLRCPDCGYGMSYQPVQKKGKTYEYYSCNQYMNKKKCKANSIRKDQVEKEFFNVLDNIVNRGDFKKAMIRAAETSDTGIAEVNNKINKTQNELRKLEDNSNKLFGELLEGNDKFKKLVREKIQENIDRSDELKRVILNYENKIKELQVKSLNTEEIIEVIEKTSKIIKKLDNEAQQRLIRKIISGIETKDRHIKAIQFSFGEVLELDEVRGTLSQVTLV